MKKDPLITMAHALSQTLLHKQKEEIKKQKKLLARIENLKHKISNK